MHQALQFTTDLMILPQNKKHIIDEIPKQHTDVDDDQKLKQIFPRIGWKDIAIAHSRHSSY